MPRTEVARAQGTTGIGGCAEPGCLKRLGEAVGVKIWLRATCAVDGNTYRLHMELFDAQAGEAVVARDDSCEICTEADAAETANVAASTLRKSWTKRHASTVSTAPTSPPMGPGPATSSVAPVAADPPAPTTPGSVAGAPARDEATSNTDRPAWRNVLSIVAFAGAAAAAGTGVYLVYQNNRGADRNFGGQPQNLYDTGGWAIASFGVSALLLGAGVALIALPWTISAPKVTAGATSAAAATTTRPGSSPSRSTASSLRLGWAGGSALRISGAF